MTSNRVNRREIIALIGAATLAWPITARAQQQMPVIGFMSGGSRKSSSRPLSGFLRGLAESGFVEQSNVAIEYRWADGQFDLLPGFAADLVERKVNVIAAATTPAAIVAKAATATIPIVFAISGNPVQLALVESLSQPGGNLTGASQMNVEVAPKRLELMHEMMPTADKFGLLVNPRSPAVTDILTKEMQSLSSTLGLRLQLLNATRESDFAAVFATAAQQKIDALVIGTDPLFTNGSEGLAALALSHRLPAIYQYPESAEAGGLMSYGGNNSESYRLAGVYAGRILKGAKPASLAVRQVTKLELIVNRRTANLLGLTIPPTLLARADDLIERGGANSFGHCRLER
jgi:putative ABC transport system substrate-binding protein